MESPTTPGYASDEAFGSSSPMRTVPSSNEEGDSEEEQQHIVLHQQKVVPGLDDDDDATYLIDLKSGI